MENSSSDSESSGVYPSGVHPSGFDARLPGIDPAALVTRKGMPAVSMAEAAANVGQPGPDPASAPAASPTQLPPLSTEDRQALSRLLERPQLQRFWRLVREVQDQPDAAVSLPEPSESEHLAIAGVFGFKVGDGPLHLKLADLDVSLRASRFGISLNEALQLVAEVAPAPSSPTPTQTAPTPVAAVPMSPWRQEAQSHAVVQRRPELVHWLLRLEEEALPRQLAPGRELQLVQAVLEVLASLPSLGESLRPMAFRLLGDHHSLDVGKPVGELTLRALSVMSRRPMATTPEERRKLWHWAGVECDEVSSDVLTLGLRPTAGTAFCRALDAMSRHGEPMRLTLRQIRHNDLKLAAGTTVYVCQHPVVVAAAAERYPAGSKPLVVTGERPGLAVRALLQALLVGGAKLFYHGDFDWHGIRVANDLYRTFPFQPWRFRAGDYIEASRKQVLTPDLVGHPVYARWDEAMADAMAQHGKAIEEERVLSSLLGDLSL